ncbi:MAG: glycosyltransferase family 39 protein [Anaerolineales bacterium]|nr:glycosyltransferase family 39 protein [Anaerolineales bacterium]
MDSLFRALKNKNWPTWTPELLALLGAFIYLIQALLFAHTTPSNLDEGGYLYKGLLFAEGVYQPFQPYGFWTNKAPLAFLIPGYVQDIFGAGMRTGRYLAVLQALLALLGMWVVTRRLSNRWFAALSIWVLALSPAVIKVYSVGASQSLVAFFIAWVLVFSVGARRPLWQLILGSVLASLMILARQNMVLTLPLLILYILWEHGWKAAFWSGLAGGAVFVIGHIIYWPEILQIWVIWLPFRSAALNAYLTPSGGSSIWRPDISTPNRVLSFFQGFRWHFFALTGGLFSILLLPQRKELQEKSVFRAIVFLSVLFLSLLYLHSSASLDRSYCVFCFAPYLSFFNILGVILVFALLGFWNKTPNQYLWILTLAVAIVVAAGIGFASFEDTGKWVLNWPVPRLGDGKILPGLTTLGETLYNKFAFEQNLLKRIASTGLGLLVGGFIVCLGYLINLKLKYNYAYGLSVFFLLAGVALSPILAGAQGAVECNLDVISANEKIGAYLNQAIPTDSSVYWEGGLSVVPLLYAPYARIYPPQVNDGYAFRQGFENTDALLKYGLWNSELAQRWRNEADIIILEEWRYPSWKSFLSPQVFEELPRSPESTSCLEGSRLRVFKRIK